jgi:hypothetical protein
MLCKKTANITRNKTITYHFIKLFHSDKIDTEKEMEP